MIDLKFGLFWSGSYFLSYLRYLTFKTLRHFHPESEIQFYISKKYNKSANKWQTESQDFKNESESKNYIYELADLNVDVIEVDYIGNPELCPVLQADLFRWMWMKREGGFYLDTDQIILKSFSTLPLEKEFIYCRYNEIQCGDYFPVGVLGLEKNSTISDSMLNSVIECYSPFNYNSSGPFMMRSAIKKIDLSNSFNAPYYYFYPLPTSKDVSKVFSNSINVNSDSYCLHWFGGHPLSQEFNKNFTKDFSDKSNDTISVLCRKIFR